jgi:DNA repair exonuclease SbcCD ATPase subunit
MTNLSSAHVQSLAALAEFRGAVGRFRADAQDALASLTLDLNRARDWLADRRRGWERAVRECHNEVVHAKAELSRRQTVPPGDRVPDTSQQEEDLKRAKARLRHAEEQVERCRRWATQLERSIEEFEGPVRRLGNRVEIDLPKAAGAIERMLQRLEAYMAAATAPPARAP